MDHFAGSLQHLLAELERVDLLIQAQVARVRSTHTDDEQFRGLYISEEEVDALLRQPVGRPHWLAQGNPFQTPLEPVLAEIRQRIEGRKQESQNRGIELRLDTLQRLFQLDAAEIDALLICLASELDLRYERLYAYLQDDVTKKKPGVDLVLNLLFSSAEEKLNARRYFSAGAPLIRYRILAIFEDPSQPHAPLLSTYLKVDDRITDYLLGSDETDTRIQAVTDFIVPRRNFDDLVLDEGLKIALIQRLSRFEGEAGHLVLHVRGPAGVGKKSVAEALCKARGVNLLVVDLERLAVEDASAYEKTLGLINREARLRNAALFWDGFDGLLNEQNTKFRKVFSGHLAESPRLSFLAGEMPWQPEGLPPGVQYASIDFPRPPFVERSRLWKAALETQESVDTDIDLSALASKFKFTGGQIQGALATARDLSLWRSSESGAVSEKDLYEACRLQSNQKLSSLARKITPKYKWEDIVLPTDRLAQLREICNHVKYRDRVYTDWGFGDKLALGKGLSVLFAGPSGTGKTMSADIIAGELGLDLYKIDLSTVISKYIGETEKNLSRIFTEAETSNAILFFDEADALFGKRSEVKDSHDRYANIEIGYLLQRMEEYEGVVILATNFRKNMDEAFVRRLHFTVEFPFPGEQDRHAIWQGIWPYDTPLDAGINLEFVARRFQITGGNIRNIALSAAFLAADEAGVVEMRHLIRATQREYQKMGKVITDVEFREYSNSA